MRNSTLLIVLIAVLTLSGCAEELAINKQETMRLVHDVYFLPSMIIPRPPGQSSSRIATNT